MNMLHSLRKTTMLLGAVAVLGTMVAAGCGHHRRSHEGPMDPARVEEHVKAGVDRMLSKIDATDTQRQKVYAIRDREMPDILAMVKGHNETMKEVRELWNQPTLDAAKLDALCDKRSEEMRAMFHRFNQAFSEFHAVLTPEQRAKLQDLAEHH